MESRVLHWVLSLSALAGVVALLVLAVPAGRVELSESAEGPEAASARRHRAFGALGSDAEGELPQLVSREEPSDNDGDESLSHEANQPTELDESQTDHLAELEFQGDFIALADHVSRMNPQELEESSFINRYSVTLSTEQRVELETILSEGRKAIAAASEERGKLVLEVEKTLCEQGMYDEYVREEGRGLKIPEPEHEGQIRGLRTWRGKWVSVKIEPPEYPDLSEAIEKLNSAKLELLHRVELLFQ